MSRVARSLVVFGWYLVGFGALLILAPNRVFAVFGLPRTDEVWIRLAGVLVLIIAYYNVRLGRADFLEYARLTVHARTAVLFAAAAGACQSGAFALTGRGQGRNVPIPEELACFRALTASNGPTRP